MNSVRMNSVRMNSGSGVGCGAWGVHLLLFFFHDTHDTRHTAIIAVMGSKRALRPASSNGVQQALDIWADLDSGGVVRVGVGGERLPTIAFGMQHTPDTGRWMQRGMQTVIAPVHTPLCKWARR